MSLAKCRILYLKATPRYESTNCPGRDSSTGIFFCATVSKTSIPESRTPGSYVRTQNHNLPSPAKYIYRIGKYIRICPKLGFGHFVSCREIKLLHFSAGYTPPFQDRYL